jgi:hypothetical protein
MLKFFIAIACLLLSIGVLAKPDTLQLHQNIAQLNAALLKKDTVQLKQLLHNKLTYGHSNGWVQNKQDMVADFVSGKIEYRTIEATKAAIVWENNIASVRNESEVEGTVNGTAFKMKLHIVQVWVWKQKKWLLLSRQSVKLTS